MPAELKQPWSRDVKDLLLLIRDDAGQPARLKAAVGIARLTNGAIACYQVDESDDLNDEIASATVDGQVLRGLVHSQGAANRRRVERELDNAGVAWTWADARGRVADLLGREAAFHDLTIVNTKQEAWSWREGELLVSDLVRATHQPLLLVPHHGADVDFARHAFIAWDGSPPCVAAVRAAVPLLAKAKVVTLVEVGEDGPGATLERGAEYLTRNGIHPHLERVPGGRHPSHWLLARSARLRDVWCVMGAFGHSRAREAVFGGTTLEMLDQATVPLFVAH
jgi:nucleotide-binding universal stress UspA family protein